MGIMQDIYQVLKTEAVNKETGRAIPKHFKILLVLQNKKHFSFNSENSLDRGAGWFSRLSV